MAQRADHAARVVKHPSARIEDTTVVPLVDEQPEGRVYDGSLLTYSIAGMAAGALVLGPVAYAVGSGLAPVAGLGQFAASGEAVATFVGAGVGAAAGGLVGGLVAVWGLARRRVDEERDGEAP